MNLINLLAEKFDTDATESEIWHHMYENGSRLQREEWGQAHGWAEGTPTARVLLVELEGYYAVCACDTNHWVYFHFFATEDQAIKKYGECVAEMNEAIKALIGSMELINLMSKKFNTDDNKASLWNHMYEHGARLQKSVWGLLCAYGIGHSEGYVAMLELDGFYAICEGVSNGWKHYHIFANESEAHEQYDKCSNSMKEMHERHLEIMRQDAISGEAPF